MGEQQRRAGAGHVPPEGMVNVSGKALVGLARDIHDRIVRAVDHEHMDIEIAAQCAFAVATDLLRVNASDREAERVTRRFVDQRFSKPLEYWGTYRAVLQDREG